MGAKVQSKMYMPGYYSLRDQRKNIFGEYRDFFLTRPAIDVNEGNDKEQLRETILKHECVFKHQLHELHRVYKIQRDMMNEVRSKELLRKHMIQSSETLESGCKRLRRRLFDLELPADTYINDEEEGPGVSGLSKADSYLHSRNHEVTRDTVGNLSTRTVVNSSCYSDLPCLNSYMKIANGLNNLNEPINIEESSVLGNSFCSKEEMERRVLSYKFCDGGEVSRNNMNLETERKQKGWLAYNADAALYAGQTGSNGSSLCASFSPEDLPKTSKPRQVESHVKKIFGVEICERSPGASVEASGSLVQHPFSTLNSELSASISHKNLYSALNQNISTVQGNPSFSSFAQSNKLVNSNSCIKADLCHSSWLESKESSNAFNGISDSSSASEHFAQASALGPKRYQTEPQGVLPSCNGNSSKERQGLNSLHNLFDKTEIIRKRSSPSFVQDSLCALDAEVGECSSNRKILGFSISEKPFISKDSAAAVDTKGQHALPLDSEQHKAGKGVSRNHHIDLNLCFVEEKAQSSNLEIDFEAPVVVEEMDVTPGAEVVVQDEECRKPQEELIKVAAEALVAISSSCPSEPLHWFAELISSYKGNVENESGDHGMDYLELMTLNLSETNVEEYHYEPQPQVLESPKNDYTLLTRRPRRGQARRGRQRKNFQRDILPTVASLSKNEVTDDLQTIQGLIRATGGTWQSSLSLKNAGRGKGRRANVKTTSPPKCRDAALEETSLIGWGKRTRRPPRQRFSVLRSL
ncbi:hypothetical protein Ddye_008885 [Dipteronia dyeriana]|uniref:Uncharacterized protein n=1 Tax=Dipteronia dyeriana TaxID=168575 RepID=A0AAD9XAL5_9ROSI|nr:hypothetical protein Ddye_008885 [Dipteronia dyeriana]